MSEQPAILKPQRRFARYFTARRRLGVEVPDVLRCLGSLEIDDQLVVGLGPGLARLLGVSSVHLNGAFHQRLSAEGGTG